MLFAIIGKDAPGSAEKRPLHREEHLKRLDELNDQGKLVLAGPFTDVTGSLIIIEAETIDEARAFADGDPYTIHGIFESVEIKPFKQVYPMV